MLGRATAGPVFLKDTLALVRSASELGVPTRIVEAVVAVNDRRKTDMAKKVEEAFGGVKNKTIAVLGLTFKPNTDDMRDAPSLVILPHLQRAGATIRAYDPEGNGEAQKLMALNYCQSAYEALENSDGVVILTEWNEFRAFGSASRKKPRSRIPLIVDLRNIYRPAAMREAGFTYISLGRP